MGVCAFCQKEEKLTSEHVWGDWIRPFVPATKNKHHFGQLIYNLPGVADEQSTRIRAGDPTNAQVEILCRRCNNVGLGKVHEASKSLMIPLFKEERCLLSLEKQKQIATWATMASMTAEYLSRDEKQIAVAQAERGMFLQNNEPLSNWRIWVGNYHRWRFPSTYVHTSLPILTAAEVAALPDMTDPQSNTQSTSILLGRLFIHAISSSAPTYVHNWGWNNNARAQRMLVQIWPPREEFIAWPIVRMNDLDARNFSTAFFDHLHNIGRLNGY